MPKENKLAGDLLSEEEAMNQAGCEQPQQNKESLSTGKILLRDMTEKVGIYGQFSTWREVICGVQKGQYWDYADKSVLNCPGAEGKP